jgi:DNA repair protein RecN (Recombination protein N)
VELHGQHEHQALLDPLTHLPLLDEYAGLEAQGDDVSRAWSAVAALRQELDRAGMDVREREARLELVDFQLAEIGRVNPSAGEDEALAVSKQVLSSADRIQRLCADSYADLYESDGAALASLARVWRRIGELAAIEPAFEPYAGAGEGIKSQLEDLAWFVRDYGDRIEASPERLQEVEDRLASLERLKRKYGGTLDEVIRRREGLVQERGWLERKGDHAGEVQGRLDEQSRLFLERARVLSAGRRRAAGRLASELRDALAELAMRDTRVEIRFNRAEPRPDEWSARGIDQAEMYLSPNPGEDLRPLARIVSGGELSRVMLGLKALGARARARQTGGSSGAGRTLIFDEVDAGISGRVADVVGARLQELGSQFQVLCITHLPQIAARGTEQFRITKIVRGGRTVTAIQRLDDAMRIEELARMMGGEVVTEPLRSGARELLLRAQQPVADVPAQDRGRRGAPRAQRDG